jgi:ApaG protein
METLTTSGITISVVAQYLAGHSNPRARKVAFGYKICITNGTEHTVQLLSRHWHIWEADNARREVTGEGVVGVQPVLEPGVSYTYASFCTLACEVGKMYGTYTMLRRDNGELFTVKIPEFKLIASFRMN